MFVPHNLRPLPIRTPPTTTTKGSRRRGGRGRRCIRTRRLIIYLPRRGLLDIEEKRTEGWMPDGRKTDPDDTSIFPDAKEMRPRWIRYGTCQDGMKSDIEGGRGLLEFPEVVLTNGANNAIARRQFGPQIPCSIKIFFRSEPIKSLSNPIAHTFKLLEFVKSTVF